MKGEKRSREMTPATRRAGEKRVIGIGQVAPGKGQQDTRMSKRLGVPDLLRCTTSASGACPASRT